MEFKNIVTLIIILFLLIGGIWFLYDKGGPLVKAFLGIGEETLTEDITSKSGILYSFSNIVKNYEICLKSNNNDCICSKDKISVYPSNYFIKIWVSDNLYNVITLFKDNQLIATKLIKANLKCIVSQNEKGDLVPSSVDYNLVLTFDKKGIFIYDLSSFKYDISTLEISELSTPRAKIISSSSYLYKSKKEDSLCLITYPMSDYDLKQEYVNKINSLPTC